MAEGGLEGATHWQHRAVCVAAATASGPVPIPQVLTQRRARFLAARPSAVPISSTAATTSTPQATLIAEDAKHDARTHSLGAGAETDYGLAVEKCREPFPKLARGGSRG